MNETQTLPSHLNDIRIAIVGGGPAGLMLARILQIKSKAIVRVYERDAHRNSRGPGAVVGLGGDSGLNAIRRADLIVEFKKHFQHRTDKVRFMNKDGKLIFAMDLNVDDFESNSGLHILMIDRGALRTMLLDSLLPDTVQWGKSFLSLTQQDDCWRLDFKDGTHTIADLVIGADGANSKVRAYLTPSQPVYCGVVMLEGRIENCEKLCPEVHKMLGGGIVAAIGDSKSMVLVTRDDGSVHFYPGFKVDEEWWRNSGMNYADKERVLKWFREEYRAWSTDWEQLFENATSPFIPRPQYFMPIDESYEERMNLTMIGDAAHLMTPYGGQGVNMALMDALELGECLCDSEQYPITQLAIRAYESGMRKRVAEAVKETKRTTFIIHSRWSWVLLLFLRVVSLLKPCYKWICSIKYN